MRAENLPSYKELPIIVPPHYRGAWGLFDPPSTASNGDAKLTKDSLGTLNLLTPTVVASAASEIRAGVSVSLNWGLEKVHEPAVGRCHFEHKVIDLGKQMGAAIYSWDDEVRVNTQSGSQWDGLRHWGHKGTGLYYNGIHHEELIASPHLGMNHINDRGGVVGRGVMLDYVAYAARHDIRYDPMSKHAITLADIKAMAAEEKLEFRASDILIIRTGWIKWYEEHSPEEREAKIAKGNAWIGVDGCEETAEWLWDNHFAAVAGDSIGWECWPHKEGWSLHDHLLALWGMPVGEMWDLEALAAECEKQQRWSFFLTSAPLNVTGGVASPPNALAVF